MKKLISLGFIASFLWSLNAYAQVSGNQVYGSDNSSYQRLNIRNNQSGEIQKQTIYTTDSTLVITSKILMNKVADAYLISIGLNQEGKTVLGCNTKINSRINNLISDLKEIEIEKEAVYVDFISQTKIYDYTIKGNNTEQVEDGFEIKKNLIIRIDEIEKIDRLLELCALQKIYDVIKVEYINEAVNTTYLKMYDEALSFINSRKKIYLKINDRKVKGNARISGDNFQRFDPKKMYLKYQASESSSVHGRNYSSNYIHKEARKNKTFYYEGVGEASFDKVINESSPKVGIQYALTLTIIYDLEK